MTADSRYAAAVLASGAARQSLAGARQVAPHAARRRCCVRGGSAPALLRLPPSLHTPAAAGSCLPRAYLKRNQVFGGVLARGLAAQGGHGGRGATGAIRVLWDSRITGGRAI
jgi:hypothetical protein